MYKPYHLIGLELGISVASAGLRHEATGAAVTWNGDVVATAKRDLKAGELLDGEGGYTVWGKLMPAAASLAKGALPIGLAHRLKLKNDVAHGAVVGLALRHVATLEGDAVIVSDDHHRLVPEALLDQVLADLADQGVGVAGLGVHACL